MSEALGLTPVSHWIAGESRVTPTGRPLEGVRRDSYWYSRLSGGQSSKTQTLSRALGQVVEELEPKRQVLLDFVDDGGEAELFIGWFFDEGNSGDVFPHQLLRQLADLCLDVAFDVYPTAQTVGPRSERT